MDYKPGDDYQPYMTIEYPTLELGVFDHESIIKREFGTYRIIHFLRKQTGVEFRDIFRVSDGQDLWLGCCSKEQPDINMWLETPILFAEPTNRSHLNSTVDITNFLHLESDPIEFFTALLLEVSETELENHFNSLQFA